MQESIFKTLDELTKENDITTEEAIEKLRIAILKAVHQKYPDSLVPAEMADPEYAMPERAEEDRAHVVIDPVKKEFRIYLSLDVVENYPLENEIILEQARLYKPDVMVGDRVEFPINPADLLRKGATSVKQSLRGDLREISKTRTLKKFEDKVKSILTVKVTQISQDARKDSSKPAGRDDRGTVTVEYEGEEIYLFSRDLIPNEELHVGQIIKVYLHDITNKQKRPTIKISRSHRGLVEKLFEENIPEIKEGIVKIHSIAREAGSRTKISVYSTEKGIDAIGSCIGKNQSRISAISKELNDEKIDVIPYSEDMEEFIKNAISPAKAKKVTITKQAPPKTEEQIRMEREAAERGGFNKKMKPENEATVIVPNDELSLAIGNKGQNAKLAAKLTGFKIDIRPEETNEINKEKTEEISEEIRIEADENTLPETKVEDAE